MKSDLAQIGRGILMGGADIIPGVSGGTMALILGIYERWVFALSRFDVTLLRFVRRGEWLAAARHVDLRFLVTLGIGVGTGIVCLAGLMNYLLEHELQHTYAVFFGLILASSLLVFRMVQRWSPLIAGAAACGAVAAFVIVGLPLFKAPPAGDGYAFVTGMTAICATILPGISGAYIMVIMGKYEDITGLLRAMLHGDITLEGLGTLGAFALGAGIGLLVASKILRRLLARFETPTFAVLCGFMLGSLRKIWPFKLDLTPEIHEMKLKQFRNVWPDTIDGDIVLSLILAVVAFGFVLLLDKLTNGHTAKPHMQSEATTEAD